MYKKDIDSLKTKNSTLQTLIQAILNAEEEDVAELVRQIRTCDNLEELAVSIEAGDRIDAPAPPDSPTTALQPVDVPQFEAELSGRMGDLWLDGSVKFIGGTSNLIWLTEGFDRRTISSTPSSGVAEIVKPKEEAIISWTTITKDKDLILHFMNMYFCWHYAYFTTLSKELFYRDFLTGTPSQYCSALLVNVMLALGCHFSNKAAAKADPEDSSTTGDHYFKEAKRLLYEDDEFANAKLCTVQALALMSVREAGCGRESKGWVYSGMSFRMASDLGLNIDAQPMNENSRLSDEDIDARRITFWGCFLFDKCWSNYLGRQPQLQLSHSTVKKPVVFPSEDSEMWSPYTDSGIVRANAQPARTRTVALQLSKLAEISGDLLASFYHPGQAEKPLNKQHELKKLSDVHTRLESWKKELPAELEPRDSQLPQVLLMHMFHQLLYIHLYRPFLRYTKQTSPLPSHASPRKFCTQAAGSISKLFRLYKRTHGLRQICNIAIYILHTACTIHILNMPDKTARRDIAHGAKHLEEMGECWSAARRTLQILRVCAEKWKVELPDEAEAVFTRADLKWGRVISTPSPAGSGSFGQMLQHMEGQNTIDQSSYVQPTPYAQATPQALQQQQQLFSQHLSYAPTGFGQLRSGLSATMSSLPTDLAETRHDSSNLPVLPRNTMGPSGESSKLRTSTYPTKAQQDLLTANQARLSGVPSRDGNIFDLGTASQADGRPSTGEGYGSMDSLTASQDWWYKDQSQLAMGFDNWNEPSQDWYAMDINAYNTPDAIDGTNHQTPPPIRGGGFVAATSSTTDGAPIYGQRFYRGPTTSGPPTSMYSDGVSTAAPVNSASNAYQRLSYDDDAYYGRR